MECDIQLGGDGEPFDEECDISTSTKTATCCECERTIQAGIEHEVCTASIEAEEVVYHTCPDCHAIATALQTNGRTYTYLWGELEEHGGDDGGGAFEEFNSGCLLRIETASAKAYVLERYRKWKGLVR